MSETTSKLALPRAGDAVLLSVDGLAGTLACAVVGLTATTLLLAPHVARLDELRAAGRAAALIEWNTRHGRARLSGRLAMGAIDGSTVILEPDRTIVRAFVARRLAEYAGEPSARGEFGSADARKTRVFYDAGEVRDADHLAWRAFTKENALELTSVSAWQLQYWNEQGLLSPSLRWHEAKGRRRLYDFRDLVALRVAGALRAEGLPLQHIRRALEHLRGLDYEHPLSDVCFWTSGGRLYFEESKTVREERRPARTTVTVQLPEIVDDLERRIEELDRQSRARSSRAGKRSVRSP